LSCVLNVAPRKNTQLFEIGSPITLVLDEYKAWAELFSINPINAASVLAASVQTATKTFVTGQSVYIIADAELDRHAKRKRLNTVTALLEKQSLTEESLDKILRETIAKSRRL
jgi:hypothetical protein